MSLARAERRRRERAAKKEKRKASALLTLMSDVHVGIARSSHPKRAKLLLLSREMLAIYNGIELEEGVEEA